MARRAPETGQPSSATTYAHRAAGAAFDESLSARKTTLRSAFEELSLLRWGRRSNLPKASFDTRAQAVGVADLVSDLKEGLRAAGGSELESAIDEGMHASRQEHPGELTVQVELGKTKAPSEERFRELLDRAVRNRADQCRGEPGG